MKEYKANYCISLLYHVFAVMLCLIPLAIVADIYAAYLGKVDFGTITLLVLACFATCCVGTIVFVILINLILRPFIKNFAILNDSSIYYGQTTLMLHEVRYITLYLPEASKRSSKPQILTLWADNTHYMNIKRPSIALIVQLKKWCPNAKFHVDDWKGHIRQWSIVSLCMAILIPLIFYLKHRNA